jgi:predicted ATPase
MKYFITTLALVFIFNTNASLAQDKKPTAHENIIMLKSGALLVRLKTSTLKINALKENGRAAEANEIKVNQEKVNKSIVLAFKSNFTFCPVYFFYSNNSNDIKEGNYKGFLYDVDNNIDTTFSGKNYLVGEFGESKTTLIDAFFIEDKNYEQLRSPFPFLIKQNEGQVETRSNDEIVRVLNKKLNTYYSKQ